MYRFILIDSTGDAFVNMIPALAADNRVSFCQADSGLAAFQIVSDGTCDLVLAAEQLLDMTGIEFAHRLVGQNPFVNCALVSSMTDADFHDASEGLGILAKLPPAPDAYHAAELIRKLESILMP